MNEAHDLIEPSNKISDADLDFTVEAVLDERGGKTFKEESEATRGRILNNVSQLATEDGRCRREAMIREGHGVIGSIRLRFAHRAFLLLISHRSVRVGNAGIE